MTFTITNHSLSTIHYPLSTIDHPLSIVHYILHLPPLTPPSVHHSFSLVHTYDLDFKFHFLLFTYQYPPFVIHHPVSIPHPQPFILHDSPSSIHPSFFFLLTLLYIFSSYPNFLLPSFQLSSIYCLLSLYPISLFTLFIFLQKIIIFSYY